MTTVAYGSRLQNLEAVGITVLVVLVVGALVLLGLALHARRRAAWPLTVEDVCEGPPVTMTTTHHPSPYPRAAVRNVGPSLDWPIR